MLPVAFLVWNSDPNNLVFLWFLGSFVLCYHFLMDVEQLLDDCGLAYHLPINIQVFAFQQNQSTHVAAGPLLVEYYSTLVKHYLTLMFVICGE